MSDISQTYFNFDGAAADGTDRLADEVDIDLGGVLLELSKDLGDVSLGGKADHDVQLLQLDVDWIIVFDEEHFHFMLQDVGPERS